MRRNIIETVMGAVVLIVAAGFMVLAFKGTDAGKISGYQISVEFDDASGLSPGTDVRMAGVKIGTVDSQALDPKTYFAEVVLNIDDKIELPEDTSARIIPEGLLGGNFVALEPGGSEQMLKNGDSIQFAQGAINVVDLLGRFIFSAADSAGGSGDKSSTDGASFQ
ncbi:MAG: outer membrane lipid asymmetry maintenance protein MlaD [Pseudomonadota bacterium]